MQSLRFSFCCRFSDTHSQLEYQKDENNQTFFTDPSVSLVVNQKTDQVKNDSSENHSNSYTPIESSVNFSDDNNKETNENNPQPEFQSLTSSFPEKFSDHSDNHDSPTQSHQSQLNNSENLIQHEHLSSTNDIDQNQSFSSNHFSSTHHSTKNSSKTEHDSNSTEIQDAATALVEKGKLPPSKLQPQVLQTLKTESMQLLFEENYQKAAKINKAINMIIAETHKRRKDNRQLKQERRVDHKVRKANHLLKKEEDKIHQKHEANQDLKNKKLKEIQDRHQKEIEQFKAIWDQPETFKRFNKASPLLLSLRRSQKVLALSKKFEEADEVKKEADKLQQKELNEARERAQVAYNQNLNALKEQHQKELKCFEEYQWRLDMNLEHEKNQSTMHFKNMARFYERQQEARVLPNKKPAPKIRYSTTGVGAISQRSQFISNPLPRTNPDVIAGLNRYRNMPEMHPLGLTSLKKQPMTARRAQSTLSKREFNTLPK